MNFFGELRWFCSRESSSVLACVFVCACESTGRQWAQAQESVRTGRRRRCRGQGGQRDDEEEGEKMDAPISQTALGSSKKECVDGATCYLEM